MKKFLLSTVALSVFIFVISLLAPSGSDAGVGVGKGGSKKNVVETYMVIKVTDDNKAENKVEYKAISKSQFKDEQKRAMEDYKLKMKEWHDLKKTDPTAPAPTRIRIDKIQSDYETMKIAQEYVEKLRKKEESNKDDPKPEDNRR